MKRKVPQRETSVTRAVHRLFWRASMQDKRDFVICYATRLPALFSYHFLIPFEIAKGLQAIVEHRFDQVMHHAWLVVLCSVFYAIFWSIGSYAIMRNCAVASSYVQRVVFTNYLAKDYEFFTNAFSGALGAQAARIRDAYIEYGQLITISVPRQTVIILAGMLFIGWQSALLAIVTFVTIAGVLSFTLLTSHWRLRFRRSASEASSRLAGYMGDSLSHGTDVKAFASEDFEHARIEQPLEDWRQKQLRSWMAALPADSGRMILTAVATALLLVISARLYQSGTITIAIVALIQLYVVKMISATQDIAEMVKTYEGIMGAAYQPVATMLEPVRILDEPTALPHEITKRSTVTFNKVTFRYEGQKRGQAAVSDFSLVIAPGEKIGLVGYSGSGKTTLTKLLLRFMDVSKGSIDIVDINIRDLRQSDLRQAIGYVPQEPLLFHRSIRENILHGIEGATTESLKVAAHAAYVDEFVSDLPEGYDTIVGERGVKLSGGQRQRVAIARAILKDAPILLLDEATSALDSESERLIQRALWRLMENRTAIVVAHRLSTIQRMDRIVVMDKGRIVAVGSHGELLQQDGIYQQLWAHQSGGYLLPANET